MEPGARTPDVNSAGAGLGVLELSGGGAVLPVDRFAPTHCAHADAGVAMFVEIARSHVCTLAFGTHAGLRLVIATGEGEFAFACPRIPGRGGIDRGAYGIVFRGVRLKSVPGGALRTGAVIELNGTLVHVHPSERRPA
jgi:hypothetical protein